MKVFLTSCDIFLLPSFNPILFFLFLFLFLNGSDEGSQQQLQDYHGVVGRPSSQLQFIFLFFFLGPQFFPPPPPLFKFYNT